MFLNHDVIGQAHQVNALAVCQADHVEHGGEIAAEPLLQTEQSNADSHFCLPCPDLPDNNAAPDIQAISWMGSGTGAPDPCFLSFVLSCCELDCRDPLVQESHMKAFQLTKWQAEPEVREVPVPEPQPGEVLVKIGGAGACHSDLHLMESPGNPMWRLPFTLGHENAGWVERTGAGVSGLRAGDPVLVYCIWGCGACGNCRADLEQYCEKSIGITDGAGLGHDGGIAEYLLVPSARFLLPL